MCSIISIFGFRKSLIGQLSWGLEFAYIEWHGDRFMQAKDYLTNSIKTFGTGNKNLVQKLSTKTHFDQF